MNSFFDLYENYIINSVATDNRKILSFYLNFVSLGIKAAKNKNISTQVKIKKFDLLYRQIFKPCKLKNNLISQLQADFIKENISLSLLSDMVKAFKQLSMINRNSDLNEIMYTNQLFVSPMTRILMVLNNLDMSVYVPFAALIMCAMLLAQGQDNNTKNRRFYFSKIKGFYKEAKILPLVITNSKFRFKVWCYIKALDMLLTKYKNKNNLKLSNLDLIRIIFYAGIKWFFVGVKTLRIKGD